MDEYQKIYYNIRVIGRIFWRKPQPIKSHFPMTDQKGCVVMKVMKPAIAGTLESSDAQVTVEPGQDGIELSLTSSVMNQYGRQIKATVLETLERLDVQHVRITIVDKGALDCTLKARVECAVFRSCGQSEENILWGGVVQ